MAMMQLLRLAMDAGEAYYQCRPAGLGIYASDFAGQITIPPLAGRENFLSQAEIEALEMRIRTDLIDGAEA